MQRVPTCTNFLRATAMHSRADLNQAYTSLRYLVSLQLEIQGSPELAHRCTVTPVGFIAAIGGTRYRWDIWLTKERMEMLKVWRRQAAEAARAQLGAIACGLIGGRRIEFSPTADWRVQHRGYPLRCGRSLRVDAPLRTVVNASVAFSIMQLQTVGIQFGIQTFESPQKVCEHYRQKAHKANGADYPNRTDDLPLTRRMLYQLS